MTKLVVFSQDICQDELKNMSALTFTGVVLLFLYVWKHYKKNCFKHCPDNKVLYWKPAGQQFYHFLKLKLWNVVREMEKYKTCPDENDSSYIYMFIGLCIHMGEKWLLVSLPDGWHGMVAASGSKLPVCLVEANCLFSLHTEKKIQWCYCSTLHMQMYEVFLWCLMDIITSIRISFFACLKYFSMAYNLIMNSVLSIKRLKKNCNLKYFS